MAKIKVTPTMEWEFTFGESYEARLEAAARDIAIGGDGVWESEAKYRILVALRDTQTKSRGKVIECDDEMLKVLREYAVDLLDRVADWEFAEAAGPRSAARSLLRQVQATA